MVNVLEKMGDVSVEKINWKLYIWSSLSFSLRAATTVMFVASLYLLISNLSSGFDITDESLYILLADQPENMLASVTQFGYYTSILYQLSGKDIATFNLLGLLVLLSSGLLFIIMLERYWLKLSGTDGLTSVRYTVIAPLASAILAYYHSWLLSPSYNWLALVSIFLVGAGLLSAVTEKNVRVYKSNDVLKLLISSLLIGIGGGLAFMAKPTTAAMLGVLSLLWIYAHPVYERKIRLLILSASIAFMFFVCHAIVYRDGLVVFIYELMHASNLIGLLGAGHGISYFSAHVISAVSSLAEHLMQSKSYHFLLIAYILSLILRWKNVSSVIISVLHFSLMAVGLLFWVQLLHTQFDVFMSEGYAAVAISIYFLLTAFVISDQPVNQAEEGRQSFFNLAVLFFFLLIMQLSYAFGSANGLLGQMSGAIVFLCAASLYTVHWIEHNKKFKLISDAVALLITVSIFVMLKSGYDGPYWLKGSIKEQVIPRTLLLNDSEIFVDIDMADYISQLQEVALKGGWQTGTALIDLTGRSPGATVILGGEFLAAPYLIGGYKGSSLFAQENLAQVPLVELKQAWVLTASGGIGTKQLSKEVLTRNGVNFPNDYVMVGKSAAGFIWNWQDNEYQILWRPNYE